MTKFKYVRSRRMTASVCGVLALLTFACTPAFSAVEDEIPQALTPGMRIRVLVPEVSPDKVIGTIKMVDMESVTIDVPDRKEPVSVLRSKIVRLDVSEGPRSRGVDAAIGAGIGAGIGAIAGAAAGGGGNTHLVSRGGVAAIGAILGAGLGALIGTAIPPGEHWSEMAASRYRAGFAPRLDHGFDLAVAWNF